MWGAGGGKPSPSRRGLGEGETPYAIQPGGQIINRRTRPTVIPAQAGIQNPGVSRAA